MNTAADRQPGATPRRSDTRDPARSRERALRVLFQADVRGLEPSVALERIANDAQARAILDEEDEAHPGGGAHLDGFTRTLVLGVEQHRGEIETLIARFARRWSIHRMPVVDRNVLRLGTYELLHEPTPAPVVIDEAVRLAKALSTDDSGRFVNGVLESIRRTLSSDEPSTEG